METCGMSFIKYLLFFFNAIFAILGIVIIATAIVDIVTLKEYSAIGDSTDERTGGPGIDMDAVLIFVGVVILIVAGLGCLGALKENTKMLYLFAGCLLVVILLELSVAIAAAAMRPQVESSMKKQLRESFIKNKSSSAGHKEFWDKIQMNFECCGVIGPEEYAPSNNGAAAPPASCCPGIDGTTEDDVNIQRSKCVVQKSYYTDGCEDKILSSIHGAGLAIIVTGIVFCFLEVAGIVLALWLAHAINKEGKSNVEGGRATAR